MPLMAMNATALEQLCSEHGETIREQNVLLGLIYIFSGIVYIILQLLCICALSHKDLLMRSCFKIMLAMCIVDVLTLTFNAIFTGFLSIIGASICLYPVMTSIGGHLAFGLWSCYALFCVLLGFNRCLDILCPVLYQLLFIGQRTWYWLLLPILYGLYTGSPLQRPFVYNSRLGSWFISPLPGVPNAGGYTRTITLHTITNISVSVVNGLWYILIYVHLHSWTKNGASRTRIQTSNAKMRVLLQSCITCLILSVCTVLYVAIQLWQLPDFMYVLSQITWQAISGSNSIVYLCLNRTIRRRVKARLCRSSKPSTRDERKHLFSFIPIVQANK